VIRPQGGKSPVMVLTKYKQFIIFTLRFNQSAPLKQSAESAA
jgi:hypothetical protein